jgi:hypothetical protein
LDYLSSLFSWEEAVEAEDSIPLADAVPIAVADITADLAASVDSVVQVGVQGDLAALGGSGVV